MGEIGNGELAGSACSVDTGEGLALGAATLRAHPATQVVSVLRPNRRNVRREIDATRSRSNFELRLRFRFTDIS